MHDRWKGGKGTDIFHNELQEVFLNDPLVFSGVEKYMAGTEKNLKNRTRQVIGYLYLLLKGHIKYSDKMKEELTKRSREDSLDLAKYKNLDEELYFSTLTGAYERAAEIRDMKKKKSKGLFGKFIGK
jgi:hypothetical protein